MINIKPFFKYVPGELVNINEYVVKKIGFEKYKSEIEFHVLMDIQPKSEKIVSMMSILINFQKNQKESVLVVAKR